MPTRRLRSASIRALAFAVMAPAVAVGCAKPPPAVAPAKPPEVIVGRPVIRPVTDSEDFTGRTEAVASVDLRSRVTGYLDKIHFKDGADVETGQLLFTIDPRTYQAEVEKAEAAVKQADARLTRTKNDFERAESLKGRGISPEELDRAAGDRAEAAAAVGVAAAAKRIAVQNVDFTKITAPFKGRVSRRSVDPGNLVKADDTVLTNAVQLDPIYANFDVDDRTLLRIRRLIRGGKVESARTTPTVVQVGLPDKDGYDLTGTVDFIDTKVDPGTGTLRVRAVVPNPTFLLSPGLFVRVRLPIGAGKPAVLVPEEAVGTDQGEKFIYVVNAKDEVEYRPVRLGGQHEGLRVVMPTEPVPGTPARPSGVTPTDRIIVSGLQRVRAGGKVTVKDVGKAAPVSAPAPAPKPAG